MHKQLTGSVEHSALSLVAAASPLQEKAKRSGKRGLSGADYRAEVSEVHKQLIGSVKH